VAKQVGTAESTLRRVEGGGRFEADGVRAMVRWLGRAPEDFVRGGGRARPLIGTAGRRFDTAALYRRLDEKRKRDGLTWTQVAALVGPRVAPAMLTRLRNRGRIDVYVMVAAADWVDASVESLTYLPARRGQRDIQQ
jgi:hypothetical protein